MMMGIGWLLMVLGSLLLIALIVLIVRVLGGPRRR